MRPASRTVLFVVLLVASISSVDGRRMPAASATLVGPTPYLSTADIPAGFFAGAYSVETFEDASLSFGLAVTATGGSILGPGGATDSVDADDGSSDGDGRAGHSYVGDGSAGVLFTFPAPLPSAAAIVWTDGAIGIGTTFEAFGPGMVSLGTIGPVPLADDGYWGTTAEDRFFGVQDAGGILAVKVTHPGGQVEIDHVMFGGAGEPPPPPATCAHTFSKGSGAALVKYCVSDRGTIVKWEAPAGQEHIGVGDVWEGFVICSGTTPQAWDLTTSESGFGAATILSGPTATGITLRRASAQYQLDQVFALDTKEKDVLMTMTLTNISGAAIPDVRLARVYDPDMDNDSGDDVEMKSARSVWARDVNASTLLGTLWTFATDTAVDTNPAAACSPASGPTPATTGDARLASVTYRLGNMSAGAKKKVTFVYRAQ